MSDRELPREVKAFVERHLVTGAQADVLVLVQRDRRAWTAAEAGRELRIDPDQARSLLERLQRSGLLRRRGDAFQYEPRDAGLRAVADAFVELYPTYRVAIISLIFSRPAGPIRDFSDAFRFRGDG